MQWDVADQQKAGKQGKIDSIKQIPPYLFFFHYAITEKVVCSGVVYWTALCYCPYTLFPAFCLIICSSYILLYI